jgi:hypothetical protein
MTLLNGRFSRIVLEDGFSNNVNIGRGTPQGDRASTYVFILCMEILLIKIRSMDGEGINTCNFIRQKLLNTNIDSMTAEAYADDLTILFRMSDASVGKIMNVLDQFFRCTGLEVNKAKTQLMVTGSETWIIGQRIHDITIVDEVKILGVVIDRKLERLNDNWEEIILKRRRLVGYWFSFGLSIAGRVMVSKTYIISQAIYLMGILPLRNDMGSKMNEILIDFVSGGMRPIERRRQLLCAELGGYGVIDMNVMNVCIKSMWISRVMRKRENADYTGELMIRNGEGMVIYGTYERIGNNLVREDNGRVMRDILYNWSYFYTQFVGIGKNIMEVEIFNNNVIKVNERHMEYEIFTRDRIIELGNRLNGIKLKNLVTIAKLVKAKVEIEREIEIALTWVEYFRLRTACQGILENTNGEDRKGLSIGEFMDRGKTNCAKLRKVLEGKLSETYRSNRPNTMASFIPLWGNGVEHKGRIFVEWNLKLWTMSILEPAFKDFCFRLLHGRLYLNNALSNFSDVQPWCTFCLAKKSKELRDRGILEDSPVYRLEVERLERETIKHCLLDCILVRTTVCKTINKITKTVDGQIIEKTYWEGGERISKIETVISI